MTKKNCSVESRMETGIMRPFHNKKNERDRVPNFFWGVSNEYFDKFVKINSCQLEKISNDQIRLSARIPKRK